MTALTWNVPEQPTPQGQTGDPQVPGAGRGDRDWLLNGHGVLGDENILELGSGDGCCGSAL